MEDQDTGAAGAAPEAAAAASPTDEIKNIKAEMNRKLSNLEQSNAQLLAQLQALSQPKPAPQTQKKVSVFEDEDAYAQDIISKADRLLEEKLSRRDKEVAKQQAVISGLVSEFPELADTSHSLSRRAVEIYNGFSEEEKVSPIAYKAAVKEAALELDVKPKHKRKASEDEAFALSGSGSSAPKGKRAGAEGDGELDPRTVMFAEMVGMDLTKEVKERMVKKHGRKTYSKWA